MNFPKLNQVLRALSNKGKQLTIIIQPAGTIITVQQKLEC